MAKKILLLCLTLGAGYISNLQPVIFLGETEDPSKVSELVAFYDSSKQYEGVNEDFVECPEQILNKAVGPFRAVFSLVRQLQILFFVGVSVSSKPSQ